LGKTDYSNFAKGVQIIYTYLALLLPQKSVSAGKGQSRKKPFARWRNANGRGYKGKATT